MWDKLPDLVEACYWKKIIDTVLTVWRTGPLIFTLPCYLLKTLIFIISLNYLALRFLFLSSLSLSSVYNHSWKFFPYFCNRNQRRCIMKTYDHLFLFQDILLYEVALSVSRRCMSIKLWRGMMWWTFGCDCILKEQTP